VFSGGKHDTPLTSPLLRDDLAQHLSEPVGSAARKDFTVLRPDMTVEGALTHIRQTGIGEKIIYFYVADANDRLVGVVPTRRLLINPLDKQISELMVAGVMAIPDTATLLEACELFVLYKYLAFPVVDAQRHLVGVIDIGFFAAEVFEMTDEEAHDEVFEAIGLHVEQLRNASAGRAFHVRFPWLLGTIASGVMCAFLAGAFEKTLAHALTITFFLPLVLGLNESVAMQSMSLSLQSLHGSGRNFRWVPARLRRELATAFLLGLGASIIAGIIAGMWRRSPESAVVIASTILGSLVVSGVIGFCIPLLLRSGKRDPKIAAGPITLALVDVSALLLYFTLATFALK
jgi:magnesium transporter